MADTLDQKYKLPSWDIQVYRNIHNLCVYCGKPIVTIIFSDVPVCEDHKDIEDEIFS